jgi:hypothetical protein
MTASNPAAPDWEADVRQLHVEAAGVLRLLLFTASDVSPLVAAVALGDSQARRLLRALDTFRERIEQGGDAAPLCLTCDHRLGSAQLLMGLLLPAREDVSRAMAIGICAHCNAAYQDRSAAEQAVAAALRRMLWPDLRQIRAPSAPGRA